jgi:transforming growth factor-beta-induced protein
MRLLLSSALVALLLAPSTTFAQHNSAASRAASIPAVAKNAGQFTTLLAAVDAAGLTETLLGRGPFTVFAPTDDAFKRLPVGTVEELLTPQNRDKLREILTYHVIAGRVTAAQARSVRSAATVAGASVRISESDGQLRINDATVRIADIPASNGLIHVIDRVLLPPEKRTASATNATMPGAAGSNAVALIDYAIDRGAPLFNDGQPAATIAIYEVALNALLSLNTESMNAEQQRAIRAILREDRGSASRDRAFALRRVLDDARRSVKSEEAGGRNR